MGVYEELEKATEELGDKIGDLGKALPEEPDIEQPTPPDGMPTWGEAVSGALINKIQVAWELTFDVFMKKYPDYWETLIKPVNEWIVSKLIEPANEWADKASKDLIDLAGVDESIKKVLNQYKTGYGIVDLCIMGPLYTLSVMSLVLTHLGIAREKIGQSANKDFPINLPDATSIIVALLKDPKLSKVGKDFLSKLGLDDEAQQVIKTALMPLLSSDIIGQLMLRGFITEAKADEYLKEGGMTTGKIDNIKKLWHWIPGVQDVLHMAVREAFSPEIISKYRTHENLPDDFVNILKETGGSEKWAKAYWAAHWELPSVEMGYQMLHRDVINEDDLDTLLRTKDIMPYWRDKLKEISYNLLTRVDVRRMHKIGVLDNDELTRTYQDIGYNEYNAGKMAEFTILYNATEEIDITKAELLTAYKSNLIDERELTAMLEELGLSEDRIEFIIAIEDLKKAQKERDLTLSQLKNMFKNGLITEITARARLGALEYDADEVDLLIKYWQIEKPEKGTKRTLSLSQAQTFYKQNIINAREFYDELKAMKYNDERAGWIVESMNLSAK